MDDALAGRLPESRLREIVDLIPAGWLEAEPRFADEAAHRRAYVDYLWRRLQAPRPFVEEAVRARAQLV